MRIFLCGLAVLAVAACEPTVPNSVADLPRTGQGVGFGDYDSYAANRETQLAGGTTARVNGPVAVQSGPLDQNQAAGGAVNASPDNPAPQIVRNSAGISGENDFDAVAAQRDIKDDAALIAQNRAQYQVIEPTALPTREGSGRPNIVQFALKTTNPKGTALYKRSRFNSEKKFQRACAPYNSADVAQEEFLAQGGPEKDKLGMDPDGDGFACDWNPAPYRVVRGG